MTNVRLEGFREFDRALGELPKATAKGVLRRVAKGALEPMAADARAKAPRDKGDLAASITVSEKRTRRAKGSSGRSKVGGNWRSDPKNSIDMAMGPSAGGGVLNYATFAEFGTIDTAASPYMRTAWDRGASPALDHVKNELGGEILKAANRLAKKRLKLGG